MAKSFKLSAEKIKPVAVGYGSCFATDQITVHGNPVGYMYREKPDNETDSGWRFFSGVESDKYVNDPCNLANYDPDIIPFLDSKIGVAFVRSASGHFVPDKPPPDND